MFLQSIFHLEDKKLATVALNIYCCVAREYKEF